MDRVCNELTLPVVALASFASMLEAKAQNEMAAKTWHTFRPALRSRLEGPGMKELFMTAYPTPLHKKSDEATGPKLIELLLK